MSMSFFSLKLNRLKTIEDANIKQPNYYVKNNFKF